MSLMWQAKMHGHDPWTYLKDVRSFHTTGDPQPDRQNAYEAPPTAIKVGRRAAYAVSLNDPDKDMLTNRAPGE